jgi:DNA-binding NtrC family response regulator
MSQPVGTYPGVAASASPAPKPRAGVLARPAAGLTALVVDDDRDFRDSLCLLVAREGFEVRDAASLADARLRLSERVPDVVFVDLGLPDGEGTDLLRDELSGEGSDFVMITGNASVESAIRALRNGALDYLTKPVDRPRLGSILEGVRRSRAHKAEIRDLRGELREFGRFDLLVGRSPEMLRVYDLISRVAPTQAAVLITGESGTGKELVAQSIHRLGRRRDGPFMAVNCGAVAKTLIESELFGHEKGSFTGAGSGRRGYFEEANGGTVLLDEIADMPPELQGKLLRVLETGTLLRVGGSETVPVDVRVIAATNRDPIRAVRSGGLREDLYYRLNVFPIALPPLRQRPGDVELLADHFLAAVNRRESSAKQWSAEAREALKCYGWPGNVRELKNVVERAAILADSSIGPDLLPVGPAREGGLASPSGPVFNARIGSSLEDLERRFILMTLEKFGGDKARAAQVLGISLKTLYTRLSAYRAAGHTASPGEIE